MIMLRTQSQETSQPIQCLLFVVQHGSGWEPIKGFVLLPSVIAKNNPKICELFTKRCNIQLLSNKKCPTLQSAVEGDTFEIVELILLNEVEASAPNPETSPRLQFSVEVSNENVVRRVFSRNAVISETQFNRGKILNAVDEENKSVIDHILSIRLRDPKISTLLHLAAIRDDKILVRMLLEHSVTGDVSRNKGITPLLHLATQQENLQVVQFLSEEGAPVNARQEDGATCLYLAAEGGCLEIFKFLVSRGGSVSIGKYDGTLPLHAAAMNGHVEILKDLLQRDVDINTCILRGRMKGCTPLYLAAQEGHTAIVQCLLDLGADVNAVNHEGQSVLHAALDRKCAETVRCILSYRPNVDCQSGTKELALLDELILEKTTKFDDVLKLLLQRGFTVSSESVHSPKLLLSAISKNDLDVVRMLLKMGAKVDEIYAPIYNKYCSYIDCSATSLLHVAVAQSSVSMVQLLIEHGANVNLSCHTKLLRETPLEVAVDKSSLELVQLLLTNGAVVRNDAISKASVLSDADIMRTLLLNTVDTSAKTLNSALLRCAESKGNLEVVKELLSFGANVNFNHEKNPVQTPLEAAVKKSNLELVKFLLTNGAVVRSNAIIEASAARTVEIMETLLLNVVDITVETLNSALLNATFKDNLEIVKVLLKSGAVIDAQCCHDTSSAVHFAVGCDMMKFFIANNAKLEIKDSSGRTPLFMAVNKGHRAVVEVLLIFGASIDVSDNRGQSLFFLIVQHLGTDLYETLLDAFFQAPNSIINSNFWRIFDESYLRNDWFHRTRRKECSKIFERHLIKVKAANLDVNDEKVILSWPLSDADDFRSDCESEIACMKTLTIGDSSITFYDILRKDVEQVASYMRNDTIHQMLKSEDHKTQFPIYASIIDRQIKKGTQRRELLDEGLKICRHLFRNFLSLPLELRERIVSYLTDQNLLVLKYAFTGSLS